MDIWFVATVSAVLAAVTLSFKYRADIIAFVSLMALVLVGVYDLREALSYLISPAVIVLFGSMVISGVIADSGLLDRVARYISVRVRHVATASLLLYFVAGVASGFVSDVAIVLAMAVLIGDVAKRLGASPAAYVIPLAFAVAIGGRLTMVGNAGNVILLDIYQTTTGEKLNILAFTAPALLALAISVPLLLLISFYAQRFVPQLSTAVKFLVVTTEVGETLDGKIRQEVEKAYRVKILTKDRILLKYSTVLVKIAVSDIPSFMTSKDLILRPLGNNKGEHMEFLIVTQRSRLVGKTLALEPIHNVFPVSIIGIVPSGPVESLESYVFRPGDEILVLGDEKVIERIAAYYRLERSKTLVKAFNPRLAASGISGLFVAVVLSQFAPAPLAFIIGTFIALLGGGKAVERLYQYVSWETLIYVGSFLAIGTAAARIDLLKPITPLLNSPEYLFAIGLFLTNTLGLIPSAVLIGPYLTTNEMLMTYVLATIPILLPPAHPAIYLIYREYGLSIKDFLKISIPATAIAILATAIAVYLYYNLPILSPIFQLP
ncbi:SLC13 family permease [Pyrobaculum aerophilum]|uniref:SLC13 family permease n=1 Tax=Pyrobaculum aerophilum TaxID=13773 RepID=A0A371QVX8_9CREN|nr:SLC13 family permease [Pyrobaculum aerophilum]RFA94268.1 SLC13 family permease [Pyrobaculum aerophilum]RFA98607.1 SLC13 family permease [Pyrobaculum aerophilum]